MLKTQLCELLDIKYPIIQGAMAWIADAQLAAAVSEAGGLGILATGNCTAEEVRKEIKKTKEKTSKPFGVNIYYLSPHVEDVIQVICEEKPAMVTTGAGNPGKHMQKLKDAGIKVFPLVSSVALAKRLARSGADALIAEGMECGGHVGEITTMALVPQIVDAVDIPVIAAGGIFDGRGLAAALSLGAIGVQMGTRFVCTDECTVHENYKDALIKAKDRDTVLTGFFGHYIRVLKNKLTREYAKLEENKADNKEFEKLGEGRLKAAVVDGDVEYGSLMAGQIAAMITRKQPVAEILQEISEECEKVILELNKNII